MWPQSYEFTNPSGFAVTTMSEETNKQEEAAPKSASERKMDTSVLRMLAAIRNFIRDTMNLTDDLDQEGTIETIKKDMVFRGYVVWILICSILIASIGLNVNSTAVVIGAMLISPLMGPILAIGLSVGTNDWETYKRALKNFGVMVVVSLITSTVYFLITPLHEAQPELLARTKPTFLDAMIGIFGGVAGIIGVSRRNRGNVIPGVAIATALMPPLCTAGYGLATWNLAYFFGALYLFMLNSLFIAGATLVIVRYLKFPLVTFVDMAKEKRTRAYMIIFTVIILLPSAWIFYGVIKETVFLGKAEKFITDNMQFNGTEVLSKKITYTDTTSYIDIFIMGNPISVQTQEQLERRMMAEGLENTVLKIHQPRDVSSDLAGKLSKEVRVGVLEDLYERNERELAARDSLIRNLELSVRSYRQDSIPIVGLSKEVKTLYPEVEHMAYARSVEFRGEDKLDTIPTFLVQWQPDVSDSDKRKKKATMEQWLGQRLALDTLRIIEF